MGITVPFASASDASVSDPSGAAASLLATDTASNGAPQELLALPRECPFASTRREEAGELTPFGCLLPRLPSSSNQFHAICLLCYAMLCYVMLCYVMLCYVILSYVMLCYVMLCYVMLCYVMLCYVSMYACIDVCNVCL